SELTTLGAVVEIRGGGTPATDEPRFWNGDIPWVSPKDMKSDEISTSADWITLDAIENSAASLIPPGAVLAVVRSGILARTVPVGVTTRPLAVNQDIKALCPGPRILPRFLFYFLLASEPALLARVSRAATVHRLSTDDLRNLPLTLPPLSEQKRIVAILDEVFEGIRIATANAEKNLANARELDVALIEGFLRDLPSDVQSSIGDVTDMVVGFAFKSRQYTDAPEGVTLLRGDNIVQGALRWEDAKRWPQGDVKPYSDYLLRANDTVIAMDRTWVKAGVKFAQLSEQDLPCLLVQRVARLRCRHDLNHRFLFHLLRSRQFERYVLSIQGGLGVPHISGGQIAAFVFAKPDLAEQGRVAEILDNASEALIAKAEAYRDRLAGVERLKQSILARAFSGQLTATKGLAA
ncbi:MAG: restriction endonuclease subunit S, partial [Hyphomonadaceae bacterium]